MMKSVLYTFVFLFGVLTVAQAADPDVTRPKPANNGEVLEGKGNNDNGPVLEDPIRENADVPINDSNESGPQENNDESR